MSAQFFSSRKLAGLPLILGCATALAATTGNPWLSAVGPTQLRFEVVATRLVNVSNSNNTVTAQPVAASSEPRSPAQTNALPAIVSATETNGNLPTIALPIAIVPEEPVTPVPFVTPNPTDNPLIITPQILAEYFRPAHGSTNGAGVSAYLPVSVGFTPPTDKPPVSSRATYKVQ